MQARLLSIIEKNKNNSEFVFWAYQNNLWLQIENKEKSLVVQYDLLSSYLLSLSDKTERQSVLADYVLEMENRGESVWQAKGKELLAKGIIY